MPSTASNIDLRRLACEANGGHQWTDGADGAVFHNWPICKRCLVTKRTIAKEQFVQQWHTIQP